jgi:hypothetical protein
LIAFRVVHGAGTVDAVMADPHNNLSIGRHRQQFGYYLIAHHVKPRLLFQGSQVVAYPQQLIKCRPGTRRGNERP